MRGGGWWLRSDTTGEFIEGKSKKYEVTKAKECSAGLVFSDD